MFNRTDSMHGQSSRHTASTMDAVECMITSNDLELETDVPKRDDERKNKSRRDQRSYENSSSRSTRRSPPPVARKHPSSPISSSSSRSRNYPSSSQKYPRKPSPSPPPPPPLPPPSSRHYPSTRPLPSSKRAYSPSDSSRERRQPTHRSRTDLPSEKSNEHASTSNSTVQETRPTTTRQEKADLSLISEDESSKKFDIRNSTAIAQSSPLPTNNGLHPASTLSDSLFDTSILPSECELSLFAKSTLSNPNTSSLNPPATSFTQTLDHINKFQTISTAKGIPSPQVEIWLKEIPSIIQKQIDLQKNELDLQEREIRLRERELAEKEKRFQEKSSEHSTPIADNLEPVRAPTKEERTPVKSENINLDIVNISPEESVTKTISSITENSIPPPTVPRKAGGKTRFSPAELDPSVSASNETPTIELYPNDSNDNQSSSSKKSIEPILSPYATELKVTSSSTSRKVEIQSGNPDPSSITKSSAQDLRLTLSKNRPKYSSNDDDETIEISPKSDEKQSSANDYQSQRSITSTPIESDGRRHRQPYPSNSYNNQRSYNHGSSSKYGSNQKRGDNADLRSRLYDQKNSKSSRSTYKNTH